MIASSELLVLGRTFRGQFPVIDQDVGILFRNVLNAFALLLDEGGVKSSAGSFGSPHGSLP